MIPNDKKKLKTFLEGFYHSRGMNFTPAVAQFWYDACQNVSIDDFERAFMLHASTSPTVPTPYDIQKCFSPAGLHMPPEEAWNHIPKDEYSGAYITQEMATAMGAAFDSIERGDFIAGRMAFIERYKSEIAKSHAAGKSPAWFYSQAAGLDRSARVHLKIEKTMEAAERKWIEPKKALDVLNIICNEHGIPLEQYHARLQHLSAKPLPLMITSSSESGKRKIAEVMGRLTSGKSIGKESPSGGGE